MVLLVIIRLPFGYIWSVADLEKELKKIGDVLSSILYKIKRVQGRKTLTEIYNQRANI